VKTTKEDLESHHLRIDGRFLVPGFSIYVLEIECRNKKYSGKYFYVGMTGDNYYPSARSALHRLAGHIDKANFSTQNQLLKGLKTIFIKKGEGDRELTDSELKSLNIIMHYYPIKGFKKWKWGMGQEIIKSKKETKEYLDYKKIQEQVSELEKALIECFRADKGKEKCLNETNENESKYKGSHNKVYKNIKKEFNILSGKSSN
jgi:hypothetical protein